MTCLNSKRIEITDGIVYINAIGISEEVAKARLNICVKCNNSNIVMKVNDEIIYKCKINKRVINNFLHEYCNIKKW